MDSLGPEAQQLYTISALAQRASISQREKALLKNLVLSGSEALAAIVLGDTATDFARVLASLRDLAQREARQQFDAAFSRLSAQVAPEKPGVPHTLLYKEVDFTSFVAILRIIRPRAGWTFADLGCGIGRCLAAAVLLFDFAKAEGWEARTDLHSTGQTALAEYARVRRAAHCLSTDDAPISIHHASFLDADWSQHDVVFAASTCFDTDVMDGLSRKAEDLKAGAYIVTLTQALDSPAFHVAAVRRFSMAWGTVTVYIQRRLPREGETISALDHSIADGAYVESESSADEDSSDDDHRDPHRMSVDVSVACAPSFAQVQRTLGSPSSPQGNSLLRAKAARAARGRGRSALSRPAGLSAPSGPPQSVGAAEGVAHAHAPDLPGDDDDGAGAATPTTAAATAAAAASAATSLTGPRLTVKPLAPMSASVAFEMQGLVGNSSPQGDALLASKARRQARSGRGHGGH